jgi:protein LTV1
MGKKKFIDKKKSATFQLLARDSSDANYDDSPGGDRVFVRIDNNLASVFADALEDNDEGNDDLLCENSAPEANGLPEQLRKEILELGFPDDGYNYLLHLRDIKNAGAGSAFYDNPKARLDQLPRDVKVGWLAFDLCSLFGC